MAINLGVHHLRAIVAVAEARSFTLAAEYLGVAQSSLSRTILEAERRLRTPMFERSTRRVALTTDGEAIVAVARRVIQHVDAGLQHIQGYLAGTRGNITIATLPSLAATLLPPVIRQYQKLYPDVTLHIEDSLSDQVAEQLQTGRADLALTTDLPSKHDYVLHPVAEDSFFLAVHTEHRYANAQAVAWTDLQHEPLIAFGPASSVRRTVDQALRDFQFSPTAIIQAQNVAAVAGLVAADLGVAPVPGFVLPLMQFAALRFIPLTPERSRTITLIHHRDRPLSPAVQAWMDVMDWHLATQSQALTGVRWADPDNRANR